MRLTCADSLGYFELAYTNINGDLAANAFEKNQKDLYNKYGFVSVDNISNTLDYKCALAGKEYKIQISIASGNGCSGTKIPSITIKSSNAVLLDKVPLADCNMYSVDMIKMLPDEGYIQFFGHDTNDKWLYQIYFLDATAKSPIIQAFKK